MGLLDSLRPKWKNSDPDVRITAARELDNPEILVEMAANDPEWFVRHRTFDVIREKFDSQDNYAYLARNAGDEEIRRRGGIEMICVCHERLLSLPLVVEAARCRASVA